MPPPSCAWCPGKPDPAHVGTLGCLRCLLSSPAGDWGTLPVLGLLAAGGVVWSWLPQPEATAFNLFFLSADRKPMRALWPVLRGGGAGSGDACRHPVALRAAALPPCSVESGVEPVENQIRVTPSSLRRQLRLGAGPDPGGRHRPSASIVGLLLLLCCADRTLRGSFEATQATGKILGFILFKSYKRINLTNPKWQLAGSAVPALVDSQSWPLGASWGPALVEGGSPGLWSRCRGRSVDTVRPTAAPQLCPRPVRRPSLRAGFWAGSPCRLPARALGSVCRVHRGQGPVGRGPV